MLTEPFIQKAKHKALDPVVANEQEKAGLQVDVTGVVSMQRLKEWARGSENDVRRACQRDTHSCLSLLCSAFLLVDDMNISD